MDLEDTYQLNDDGIIEQCDEIKSSKKWLGSAGVSIAQLEQITASVYNIGILDAKHLKATSSLSRDQRSGSLSDVRATPPLSTVSLQQTCKSWGSNGSIPDLVRQHTQQPDGSRLQRPESAKYSARKLRPSSGKKSRPQSASESQLPPKAPGMAVKGSKCDAAGRPPKYSPQQSVTTGWVGPPAGMKYPDQPSADNSQLLTYVPSSPPPPPQGTPLPPTLSGGTSGPPPVPNGTPIPVPFGAEEEDPDYHQSSNGHEENGTVELRYTKGDLQKPTLLRRPTPEPIHLCLPVMDDEEMDENEDEIIDTDRLLELAEEKSSMFEHQNGHLSENISSDDKNYEANSTENSAQDFIKSDQSEDGKQLHSSVEDDHVIIEEDGDWSVDEEVEDQPHQFTKSSVKFCEDNNVTIDITPRNMGHKVNDGHTDKSKSTHKELQLDLNSLLTVSSSETRTSSLNQDKRKKKNENVESASVSAGSHDNKRAGFRNLQKSLSSQRPKSSHHDRNYSNRYMTHMEQCEKIYGTSTRPFSATKAPKNRPVTPITKVTVDYGENEETADTMQNKVRKKKREKDIVTMVQQVQVSDSEDEKEDMNEVEDVELTQDLLQPWMPTMQTSEPVKNYYELSRQKTTQPVGPRIEVKDSCVYKTTKTIEFDDENPRETSVKSVIDPQIVHEESTENIKNKTSLRPSSAKVTRKPPISGASANDDRPGSRLGFVPMSPDKPPSSNTTQDGSSKKIAKRPVSATSNQNRPGSAVATSKRPSSATTNQKRPGSAYNKEKIKNERVSSPVVMETIETKTEEKKIEVRDPREEEIDRLIQKHLKRPPTTLQPTIDVFSSDLVSDSEDHTEDVLRESQKHDTTSGISSKHDVTAGISSKYDVTTAMSSKYDVTTAMSPKYDVTTSMSPKTLSSSSKPSMPKHETSIKNKEVSNIQLKLEDDKVNSRLYDTSHKHYASYSRCRSAPTRRKSAPVKEKIRYTKPLYINTIKQYEDDLDTEEGRECAVLQAKLAASGIKVKAETLERALYPPSGNSKYYEISAYLPRSQSLGLLSHPKVWLPVEYKQLKLAEKNLERANEIMYRQKLQEEKEARMAELAASGMNKKKKKGKKGKGKKKLKVRRNSVG